MSLKNWSPPHRKTSSYATAMNIINTGVWIGDVLVLISEGALYECDYCFIAGDGSV